MIWILKQYKSNGNISKTVNILYGVITAIRIIAVAFLVLQAVLLIVSPDKSSLKQLK